VLRDSEWALNEYTRDYDPTPDDDHCAPQGAGRYNYTFYLL